MLHETAPGLVADRRATKVPVGKATRLLLHASCVDLSGTGVVLLGLSGAGKSDLALRLIDGGARLVADDRVAITRRGTRLIARPPEAIAGLIEVRGLGIMRIEHCSSSALGLAIALGDRPTPRLPEPMTYQVLGVALPCLTLDPWTPSACAKIRLALAADRVD